MIVIENYFHLKSFDEIINDMTDKELSEKLVELNQSFGQIKDLIEPLSKNIDFIKQVINIVDEKEIPSVKQIKDNITNLTGRTVTLKLQELVACGILIAINRTSDNFKTEREVKMKKGYVINPYFKYILDDFLIYFENFNKILEQYKTAKEEEFEGIFAYFKWLLNNNLIKGIEYPEIVNIESSSSNLFKTLKIHIRCQKCRKDKKKKYCFLNFYYFFENFFKKFSKITVFDKIIEGNLISKELRNNICKITIKFPINE